MATTYSASPETLSGQVIPVLLAGIAGQLAFEFLALAVAPLLLGAPLLPSMLVAALAQTLLGIEISTLTGWAGHILAGVVVFPAGYVVFRHLTGIASWLLAGALWGVILWVIAQGVLAPVTGRPFMLGFGMFTWISLAVHGVYALVVAGALSALTRRRLRET